MHNGAVQIEAAVDAFRTSERYQVGSDRRLRPGADWTRRNARVATDLEGGGQQRIQSLIRHYDDDRFRDFDSRLEADAGRRQIVERRPGPRAPVLGNQYGSPARAPEDKARLHDL